RRRELSLRAALGTAPWRLLRQMWTESLVLSVLGGGLGLLVARAALDGLLAAMPNTLPAFGTIGLQPMVLAFCAVASLAAAFLFATWPALHAARTELGDALTQRTSDPAGGRRPDLRQVFVAAQLALSIVLLAGAGLLGRSLMALQQVDPGFDPGHL